MHLVNVHGADTHLLLMVGANLQSALEPAATTGARSEISGPAVADGVQTAPTAQADPAGGDGPQEGQASSPAVEEAANRQSAEKSLLSVEAQKDLIDVIKPPGHK